MGLLMQAQELRHDSTPVARKLCQVLRKHQLGGFKFRRQVPLGRYIADFYCPMARLVIELDGVSHIESRGEAERDQWMTQQGIHVLRFSNLEVFSNTEGVLTAIAEAARNLRGKKSPPPPLAGGGRGKGEQPAPAGGENSLTPPASRIPHV